MKPVKIPRSLGRYEIIELISEGGMGALYRARDPRIGRNVAIKLLKRGYDTPELRDRFSREAIAAGSLSHPNIVTIYDVGEEDGLPFIAMEYVRGETFSDLVCLRPPLSVSRKLQLTEEVCAGLAHAHEAGIVHRDIKPANLIVGPEGTVKILDFGIAKLSASGMSGMTLPGSIMGTLNYMSPEQVKGTTVDARADIFALGAVLYELLSHQQAFPGGVQDEVLQRILDSDPRPIAEYCPDIDVRLVRLLDRALQKDPHRRFQDIESVRKELANIRSSPAGVELRQTTPRPPVSSDEQATVATPGRSTPVHRDLAERRAQHIDEHLAAAGQAFESGDYDAAIESCNQVLMIDASDARALSQIDRIHAALDERQIQAHVAEARAQLSRGATNAAREALDAAAPLSPGHPDIARAQNELLAEQTRVRTSAIRAALERARASYEAADLLPALGHVKQALALDPQNADAKALGVAVENAIKGRQEEARARAAVDDARRRFVNGEHVAALQALEALQPASNAVVASTLEELRRAFGEIEEQRRVEKERAERRRQVLVLLEDVRSALKTDRFDEALRVLAVVREMDATVPELPDLTERVNRAQAAARVKAEFERALGDFEERLAQGDLPRAGDILKTAAVLVPNDTRVDAARRRLDQAAAARTAKEAADARRRQCEEKMDEANARLESGNLAGAADLLKLAAELSPNHPRAAELSHRLGEAIKRQAAAEAAERLRRQVAELIGSATRRLQSADDEAGDLNAALRDVGQALALDAGNADAKRLKIAIEEAIAARRETARARAASNNARRRFANGKHQAALRLLEEFQPSSHPEIVETLSELRGALLEIEEQRRAERARADKQQRIGVLLSDARAALAESRFDAALHLLANVAEIDAAVPELASLTERVRKEQAAAQLAVELDNALADVDASIARDDLDAARDSLGAATALNPADARVQAARQRVDQAAAALDSARAAARDLEARRAAAERLIARGDIEHAMELLKREANQSSQDAPTIVFSERIEIAAPPADGGAAEGHGQTVDELLDAAAEHLRSVDHQGQGAMSALQKIAKALAVVPGHARALGLKATAEAVLAAERKAVHIRAVINNAISRFANGKHQAAFQLLEDLDPSSHPLVADTLKELRASLPEAQQRRYAEQDLADRQRRIAGFMEAARTAITEGRFTDALDALASVRAIDATAHGLAELTEVALRAQAAAPESAAPLESELAELFVELDDRLAHNDLTQAGELLRAATALRASDPRLRYARQRVDSAIAARKARAAAAERPPDHQWRQEDATRFFEPGDLPGAVPLPQGAKPEDAKFVYADAPTIVLIQGSAPDTQQSLGADTAPVTSSVPQAAEDGVRLPEGSKGSRTAWWPQAVAVARRWGWAPIVGAGVLLLVLLALAVWAALFRDSPPARGQAPERRLTSPPPGDRTLPSSPAPAPTPNEAALPTPSAQATFAATVTGTYPFEVVFPSGHQASASTHKLVLPEGTSEVRVKNVEYFLDAPLSVTGAAGNTTPFMAPPLSSLTVYSWSELCEIAIDGRRSGYHRVTRRVVTGSHMVSTRCPDGTAESKLATVSAAGSEPVTFTKHR